MSQSTCDVLVVCMLVYVCVALAGGECDGATFPGSGDFTPENSGQPCLCYMVPGTHLRLVRLPRLHSWPLEFPPTTSHLRHAVARHDPGGATVTEVVVAEVRSTAGRFPA